VLKASDQPPEEDRDESVSRMTLRQVLLTGVEDVVHVDEVFSRFEQHPDGTVTAFFEDGTSATGDLLVAADGANSRVRRQYLPHARLVDTGLIGITGKTLLTPETRALLPQRMIQGVSMVHGPRGFMCIFHVMQFKWDRAGELKHGIGRTDAELIDSSFPLRIRTSEPIPQWQTTNVTLLGDAIHTMTPGRGVGANTALRDARLLVKDLIKARDGRLSLTEAIHAYETTMHKAGLVGGFARAGIRTGMRVMNHLPAVKRKLVTSESTFRGAGRDEEG
jgi:2-polyprenyl-6-methoxyphenol hydroxylase-like FAD-dependent oxidoreductase